MKKLVIILILSGILTIPVLAQQTFTIMAEALPPFNFELDGVVRGISADLLVMVMEKAGNPIDQSAIKIVPWARGYNAVQNDPGTVLFSMARTEQREPLFQWVGPITDLTLGLMAPKAKHIVLNSLQDANAYKIGTVRDGAPEQLAISGGVSENSLDRISDPVLNIKKLEAGRIDMFAFNVPTTRYLMIDMGINPNDYEVVYTLKQTALYFAFHKDTDPDLIARLNAALQEFHAADANGKSAVDKLIETYLGAK